MSINQEKRGFPQQAISLLGRENFLLKKQLGEAASQ